MRIESAMRPIPEELTAIDGLFKRGELTRETTGEIFVTYDPSGDDIETYSKEELQELYPNGEIVLSISALRGVTEQLEKLTSDPEAPIDIKASVEKIIISNLGPNGITLIRSRKLGTVEVDPRERIKNFGKQKEQLEKELNKPQ